MHVNIEFLGNDSMENVITSLNYEIDKTIFFGYKEVIEQQEKKTERFLKKYCGVNTVEFIEVPHTDLDKVTSSIREYVNREVNAGNKVYFDITGGESLILVAFGMLSKELNAPMHMYDIEKDILIEYDKGNGNSISANAPSRKIKLDLNTYIEMQGGIINQQLHKDIKNENSTEFHQMVEKIWNVSKTHSDYWNSFSDFIRQNFIPDENMSVLINAQSVVAQLHSNKNNLKTPAKLNQILDDLDRIGAIQNLQHFNGRYAFKYRSEKIKAVLWDGGSILEFHTYFREKQTADDCMMGVHIDWDGEIHNAPGEDVLNEVDVLELNGNIPTFISCKNGRLGATQTLHALYELETIADRFGGKYARKMLVTAKPIGDVYRERAKEMGIEIH